jgi:hypothetical protein
MLLIELNEFNRDLLQNVAAIHKLTHLQRVLGWSRASTFTLDEYETGFLEPWVQWVSVHTGVPSSQHGVKNLGDVPNLAEDQIWERWSKRGLSSIVWGVMNGNRRNATACKVFVPDPWTFSEDAHPAEYQGLISLPRYIAKNYLDFSKWTSARKGFDLVRTLVRSTKGSDFIDGLRVFWRGFRQFGPTNAVFIVFFEYLSAMAFIRAVERYRPDAAIVFINMLAHVQHHYWKSRDGSDCPQIAFAATVVDEILGKMLARCETVIGSGRVALMNALSQTCTIEEPPWILYRPNNHARLVSFLGLQATRVEPLMTYDAHAFFANAEQALSAVAILRGARIDGKPLFFVEPDSHDPCKLFYRVAISDPVGPDAEIVFRNKSARFADYFTAIVQRTGKHNQYGDLFANFEIGRKSLSNHEVSGWIELSMGAGDHRLSVAQLRHGRC